MLLQDIVNKIIIVLCILGISFFCYPNKVYSYTEEELKQIKAEKLIADARYRKQVEDEIKRAHELKMEEKKIEVLGRLQMLGASQTDIDVFQSNTVKVGRQHKKDKKDE